VPEIFFAINLLSAGAVLLLAIDWMRQRGLKRAAVAS
jgi:hypothetical protein